jgi:hypothetical protein
LEKAGRFPSFALVFSCGFIDSDWMSRISFSRLLRPLAWVCLLALFSGLPACQTLGGGSPRSAFLAEISRAGVADDTYARVSAGQVLTFAQVLDLVRAGVPGSQITAYLRATRAPYNFSQRQIQQLTQAGADSTLINFVGRSRGDFLIDAQNAAAQDRLLQNAQIDESFWNDPYFTDPDWMGEAPFEFGWPLVW